jgi:hypothetical protein
VFSLLVYGTSHCKLDGHPLGIVGVPPGTLFEAHRKNATSRIKTKIDGRISPDCFNVPRYAEMRIGIVATGQDGALLVSYSPSE